MASIDPSQRGETRVSRPYSHAGNSCTPTGLRVDTVRLARNPPASLEREASHSRVEGRVLDSLLANAHALVGLVLE